MLTLLAFRIYLIYSLLVLRIHVLMLFLVGVRSQLKQKNIDNVSKAEEQAAQQNYEASKFLNVFLQYCS